MVATQWLHGSYKVATNYQITELPSYRTTKKLQTTSYYEEATDYKLPSYRTTKKLPNYEEATELPSYQATRLQSYQATRLQSYLVTRIYIEAT